MTRRVKHKLYKKIIKKAKKYHVHDEDNSYQLGDFVTIRESKPLSKMKKWIVINDTNNFNKGCFVY